MVDSMLEGIDLTGKKVLDLGSGLGGIDFYLAQKYAVEIVGVDVEPFIVDKAEKRLADPGGYVHAAERRRDLGAGRHDGGETLGPIFSA